MVHETNSWSRNCGIHQPALTPGAVVSTSERLPWTGFHPLPAVRNPDLLRSAPEVVGIRCSDAARSPGALTHSEQSFQVSNRSAPTLRV